MTTKRIGVDEWAMRLAMETAMRSTCVRRSVGCVLLNSYNHVISTGVNGVASGMPHCNAEVKGFLPNSCNGASSKSGTDLDKCEAIHAEANALLQCPDVMSIYNCYSTTSPCIHCVKLLLNTSCQRIVYLEEYSHREALELWLRANRRIYRIPPVNLLAGFPSLG